LNFGFSGAGFATTETGLSATGAGAAACESAGAAVCDADAVAVSGLPAALAAPAFLRANAAFSSAVFASIGFGAGFSTSYAFFASAALSAVFFGALTLAISGSGLGAGGGPFSTALDFFAPVFAGDLDLAAPGDLAFFVSDLIRPFSVDLTSVVLALDAGFSADGAALTAAFAAAFTGAASNTVSGIGAAFATGALAGALAGAFAVAFSAGLESAFGAGRASVRLGFAAGAVALRAAGRAASGDFTGVAVAVLVFAAGLAAAAACVFVLDFILPAEGFAAALDAFSGVDFAFAATACVVEVMSSPLDFGLVSVLTLPFSVILDAAGAVAALGAGLEAGIEAASFLAIIGTLRLLTTNAPWRRQDAKCSVPPIQKVLTRGNSLRQRANKRPLPQAGGYAII